MVLHDYIMNLKPAWATWELISKKKWGEEKRLEWGPFRILLRRVL